MKHEPNPIDRNYIVVWDDQQGVCCPMGWDDDCDGSLCCLNKTVAIFDSTKAARKAIQISTKFAHLRLAQGSPANTGFVGKARKNIRVVECVKQFTK